MEGKSQHATLRRTHICPVETGLELLSGRWKARILWKLYNGTMRFGELRRGLPGITEKMLTQQLRELERDQLITRTQYPEVPPRVEYALSDFGRSLTPLLEALKAWGTENETQIRAVLGRQ
jgi:DNA-binding HxlR family transcriptional regulator